MDSVLSIFLSDRPALVVQLIGQAGLSDRRAIEQVLRHSEQGVGDVLVDLSELEFIDVGGVRQLIDHAAVLGIEGRSVLLTGVRPGIMRIFRICLSTRAPNLRIEDLTGRALARPDGVPLNGEADDTRLVAATPKIRAQP